jgi:tRNA G18 (ribose-2'-O)-methylase SpoU
MIPFTQRKFLSLSCEQQHKKCADLLQAAYHDLMQKKEVDLAAYQEMLSWLGMSSEVHLNLKWIADRYHDHLSQAHRSLKEHNLLPKLRTHDRDAKEPFLPIAIYLDHIRSAYNVGSILRTTVALRIGSVYFSEQTPFRDHEKVQHTAMGAGEQVPCFQNIALQDLPRPIIALDTSDAAIPIHEFIFPSTFTLILGNEEYGVSDDCLKLADYIVEIPLVGCKNSLNVGCAFAIAAAHIRERF